MYKKTIKIFFSLFLLSALWSVGIEAINIPENSKSLALLNSGSASSDNPQINLSSLAFKKNSYISFSSQSWLGNISGSQLLFVLPDRPILVSVRSVSLSDIEMRDEVASTNPIGYTGARMVDFGLGYGLQNSFVTMGMLIRGNYISLHTYRTHGALIDMSFQRNLNSFSKIALNFKNFGFQEFNNLEGSIPTQIQLGSSFETPFNFKINFDVINTASKGSDLIGSLEFNTRFIDLFVSTSSGYLGNNYGLGFEFEYSNWKVSYGTMIHALNYYSRPSFFDLSYSISK
tara:strand:- start:123 stop:983 length:861 start_codon:yes stop_codon:yes gene_type:complete